MNERIGRLLRATPRSRARNSCSLSGASAEGGSVRRMLDGIASSISASSDGAPMTVSISSRSCGRGPMWRDWNEPV